MREQGHHGLERSMAQGLELNFPEIPLEYPERHSCYRLMYNSPVVGSVLAVCFHASDSIG